MRLSERRAHALTLTVAGLCLLLALLCLCSCRYTDVLTEHFEDPVNGTLDLAADPQFQENPNAPEDLTKPASTRVPSSNQNQQESTRPVFSAAALQQAQAKSPQEQENSDKEDEAEKGKEDSPEDGENKRGQAEQEGSASSGDGTGEGDPDANGNSSESDPGHDGEGGEDGTGGKGGEGKVYNDGTYKELPEDVGSVAATGQYAVIVQMLAGKGGLSACDEETLKALKGSGAFGYKDGDGESLDSVKTAWSGDGSKNSSIRLDVLLKAQPDAVLTDGASTALNADETQALTKAGINVVSVPRLGTTYTADDDIVTAVRLVGKLLSSADTQYNAQEMAQLYVKQHDAVLKACRKANGGYSYKVVQGRSMTGIYQGKDVGGQSTAELSETRLYTAFIDSWTTHNKASLKASRKYSTACMYLNGKTMDASSGVGLSATCTSDSFVLMDYYLQQAGVVDNSFDTAKPAAASGASSLPYAIIPGNPQGLLQIEFSRRSVPSALWFCITGSTLSADWTTLGDELFPALLVRDAKMAKKVAASAQKANGLYNVGQGYQVAVVPSGLAGSWADGTVESFLLAAWAYDFYQGSGNLESCKGYLEDFCSVFYRSSYEDAFDDLHNVRTVQLEADDPGEEGPSEEEPSPSPGSEAVETLARRMGMNERRRRPFEPVLS